MAIDVMFVSGGVYLNVYIVFYTFCCALIPDEILTYVPEDAQISN